MRANIPFVRIHPIPKKEIDSFIRTLPRRLFLFPSHPDKTVRAITLRDVYSSVLSAVNYMLRFLNRHENADRDDFLSFCVEFQTSLNPFLSQNEHIESAISSLASQVADRVESELSPGFDNLCVLYDLKFSIPVLATKQKRQIRKLLTNAYQIVRHLDFDLADNLVISTLRETGEIPDGAAIENAWELWLEQVMDVRYAAFLGLGVHAEKYYRNTATQIAEIPFREEYLYELYNLSTHASFGMNGFSRFSRYRNAAIDKLANRGMAFFSWLDSNCLHSEDPETIAGFLDAFCKGPSRYYDEDPRIGTIYHRLLRSQRNDGSWRSEDYRRSDWDTEADYLYSQYHPTWVCVAALRPAQHEIANVKNRELGLI